MERVVKSRLTEHLSSNNILKKISTLTTLHSVILQVHHSTETALLYIHDHRINAIGSQKISYVCLLDHSVAFDSIDHNILITIRPNLNLHGSVLEWFKCFYLSDHCFCVKCENSFSSSHTCSCGVPKVLFLVLFFSSCIPLHLALSSHPSP